MTKQEIDDLGRAWGLLKAVHYTVVAAAQIDSKHLGWAVDRLYRVLDDYVLAVSALRPAPPAAPVAPAPPPDLVPVARGVIARIRSGRFERADG